MRLDRFERIGIGIIVVLLILIVVVWAYTPPTAQRPPLPGFPRVHQSAYYTVHAHKGESPEELGRIADRLHRTTRAWLNVPAAPDLVDARLPIYICDSLDAMRRVTRHSSWPGKPLPSSLRPVLGRYLGLDKAITAVGSRNRIGRTVAHEVVHHVMGIFSPHCPTVLNEGAAVYLSDRNGGWHVNAKLRRARANRIRGHARIELRELIELSYEGFHETKEHAHYALACLIVQFLAESEDPRVAGKLPRLYAGIDRRADPWAYFRKVYDGDRVSRLWHEHVGAYLKRTPKRARGSR